MARIEKSGRRSFRRAGVITTAGVLATVLASACGDSGEESIRAAALAEGCTLDSDCKNPFVCAFQRCHEACREDRDCDNGEQRCVTSSTTGVNVCQLSDEIACRRDKDCPGDQACGVDRECRDLCHNNSDCVGTQICANSGECASTVPGKDRIDDEGNVLPDGDGDGGGVTGSGGAGGADAGLDSSAGGAGASGSGGSSAGSGGTAGADASAGSGGTGAASGSGGTVGTGGAGGAGGAGGTVGGASDGATGTGGSAGTADAGSDAAPGDGGPGPGYHETPDGVESIPNNTREVAVTLTSTASIYLPRGDHDWFSVTVPDQGRAQVIELTVMQQAGLRVGIEATGDGARGNYYPIGSHVPAMGATTTVYVSAGSGATILFHFSAVANSEVGLRADLSYRITAENDAFEPNNTKDQAAAIALNTVVAAQLMEPWVSDTDHAADDWYRVQLAAGPATFNLLSVPSSGRFQITRVNEQGEVTTIATTNAGASGSYPTTIPAPGTYYIRVAEYSDFMPPMAIGAKPGYMAEQYTFRVDQ